MSEQTNGWHNYMSDSNSIEVEHSGREPEFAYPDPNQTALRQETNGLVNGVSDSSSTIAEHPDEEPGQHTDGLVNGVSGNSSSDAEHSNEGSDITRGTRRYYDRDTGEFLVCFSCLI